jgi:hypothetical protein
MIHQIKTQKIILLDSDTFLVQKQEITKHRRANDYWLILTTKYNEAICQQRFNQYVSEKGNTELIWNTTR